ncbi:hypothetical protein VNO77_16972 [Canavalia gladiata]|uniref:Uncharacterized protein n=1 Tax=Canavalia gladiata TaxID=3824 RepID=A0AAN9LIV6_CANGL
MGEASLCYSMLEIERKLKIIIPIQQPAPNGYSAIPEAYLVLLHGIGLSGFELGPTEDPANTDSPTLLLLNFLGQLKSVVPKKTNHNNSTSLWQDFDANWHYPTSYLPFMLIKGAGTATFQHISSSFESVL